MPQWDENIEARLLAWAEILEHAVADVQKTIADIRSQATDPDEPDEPGGQPTQEEQ